MPQQARSAHAAARRSRRRARDAPRGHRGGTRGAARLSPIQDVQRSRLPRFAWRGQGVTEAPTPLTVLYLDINTEWRGGQRQLLWMGEGLRRHGGRPIFALRSGVPLAKRALEAGIQVIAINPLIAEWGPWTVMRLRRVIRRERVSIVHAQSGHTMALAALASLGTRAKIVFARRVTTPLRANRPTRWKYARADRLISVSTAGVEGLLRAGVRPARVRVVPSGVPLAAPAAPATPELLASLGV